MTVYRGNHFDGATSVEGGDAGSLEQCRVNHSFRRARYLEGFEGNFKITVRAANIAGDGVPGNENTLDQDFALVVYNIADPLPPMPPPPVKKIPVITNATYVKKTITITGRDFTAAASVEINGKVVSKSFFIRRGDQLAPSQAESQKAQLEQTRRQSNRADRKRRTLRSLSLCIWIDKRAGRE